MKKLLVLSVILFLILIFSKDNTYMLCRSTILEGHTAKDHKPSDHTYCSEDSHCTHPEKCSGVEKCIIKYAEAQGIDLSEYDDRIRFLKKQFHDKCGGGIFTYDKCCLGKPRGMKDIKECFPSKDENSNFTYLGCCGAQRLRGHHEVQNMQRQRELAEAEKGVRGFVQLTGGGPKDE